MSGAGLSGGLPGAPQSIPGFPDNAMPIVFEGFEGLNTAALRPGIKDQEMSWCDGWVPIGPNNLRTIYGLGAALYTAPAGKTIQFFAFGNIGETPYAYVLLSDGSIQQISVNTGAVTQVAPAGTIQNPGPIFGFSQWGSQYILFSAQQTNGYFIWDGTALYQAGTVSPIADITDAGINYTSPPTVTMTSSNGGATPATFAATVQGGAITTITATSAGSGFAIGDFTLLTISGGGSDTTATATATIASSSGGLSGAFITNGGTKYANTDYITLSGGGGSGGQIGISVTGGGVVQALTVLNPGTGYTSPPTITMHTSNGDGTFAAFTTISTGGISAIAVTGGGSGYTTPPTVTIIGDGTGCEAIANINASGAVTSVTVLKQGSGYSKALVQFSGGNNAGVATVPLMPFGVKGTTIDTYSSRVWIGNNRIGFFSAPANVGDFGTPNGGGAFTSDDSFLKVAYHRFMQSNGFLYLIGDSSINYVSGVTSAGTPVVTSFNNLNVDPQIGTPWPQTAQVFSRNIVFANSFGVHVSYGGAVTKISTPLDGIYNTVVSQQQGGTFAGFFPSSAVASIFGIQCYILLLPIINPFSEVQENKLLMWDGKKWWAASQELSLTFINTQEINSILTAWGTDGNALYPLFQNPSANLTKVVQSKLWAHPTYLDRKTSTHIAGIVNFYSFPAPIDISVDNENGGGAEAVLATSNGLTWTNNSGQPITWTNNAAAPLIWNATGLGLVGPEVFNADGTLLGLTIMTKAADVGLLSVTLLEQNYQTKV